MLRTSGKLTKKTTRLILRAIHSYYVSGLDLAAACALAASELVQSPNGHGHWIKTFGLDAFDASKDAETRARYEKLRLSSASNNRCAPELPPADRRTNKAPHPKFAEHARQTIDMHGAALNLTAGPVDPNAPQVVNFKLHGTQQEAEQARADQGQGSPAPITTPTQQSPTQPDQAQQNDGKGGSGTSTEHGKPKDPNAPGGAPLGLLRFDGEPALRAALVDALRGRRREIVRRGLSEGSLDLGRIARTGAGIDLGRAWQERTAPDTRRTALWIALDKSGSMHDGGPIKWSAAASAAAMILRAVEREGIRCGLSAYDTLCTHVLDLGAKQPRTLAQTLDWLSYDQSKGNTNAPWCGAEIGAKLLSVRADRRVMIVLCDQAYNPNDPKWAELARSGIELWGIEIEQQAYAPWTVEAPLPAWAHRYSTGSNALALNWARELRQHVGRVSV